MSHSKFTLLVLLLLAMMASTSRAELACAAAPHPGDTVMNADQSVIIIWDPVSKIEHFIRRASFKSDGGDFGFLIPTPTQPELAESGDNGFDVLKSVTKPDLLPRRQLSFDSILFSTLSRTRGVYPSASKSAEYVHVLDEKTVAGFNAVVLETSSSSALANWLKQHDYAMSPEIEKWSKPYVEAGWKMTALKVAKESKQPDIVAAAALRLSFKTDRPLFPYREPEYKEDAIKKAAARLLRIYLIADARYQGELTKQSPWTGKSVFSKSLEISQRNTLLDQLNIPESAGPSKFWLTEFEDNWPYKVAPADLYFSPDTDQSILKRPPVYYTQYVMIPVEGVILVLLAIVGGYYGIKGWLRSSRTA